MIKKIKNKNQKTKGDACQNKLINKFRKPKMKNKI